MLYLFKRHVTSVVVALVAVGCAAPVSSQTLVDAPTNVMKFVRLLAQMELSYYATGAVDQATIRFQIVNSGTTPIAVLNVASDAIPGLPEPTYQIAANGDLTIAHGIAKASDTTLVGRRATYAHKLLPQDRYAHTLTIKLLSRYPNLSGGGDASVQPKRLRYCAGIAPFQSEKFTPVSETPTLWLAQVTVADDQKRLCSEWFDVAMR